METDDKLLSLLIDCGVYCGQFPNIYPARGIMFFKLYIFAHAILDGRLGEQPMKAGLLNFLNEFVEILNVEILNEPPKTHYPTDELIPKIRESIELLKRRMNNV